MNMFMFLPSYSLLKNVDGVLLSPLSFPLLSRDSEGEKRAPVDLPPPPPAGKAAGPPLPLPLLRQWLEEVGAPVLRLGGVDRVDLGFPVALCGGRRRRVGCQCSSSTSLSGEGLLVGSGELGAVVSCHPLWVVRLGFARPACASASWVFRVADGEAVVASAAEDFGPELFLRVAWRCSVAGDEFFGGLYRSLPRSGLAGDGDLEAGLVEESGSGGRSPTDGAAAQLREVRGSSPADVLQPASSRRPRARRVSLEVLQIMVLARSWRWWRFVFLVPCWCSGGGDGFVRRAVLGVMLLASLFLCLFLDLGQSVCELVLLCVFRSLL